MYLSPLLIPIQEKLKQLYLDHKIFLQSGDCGYASAPSNIALVKYWGKKPHQIPTNSSLSLTLGSFRSFTKMTVLNRSFDQEKFPLSPLDLEFYLNGSLKSSPEKMKSIIAGIFAFTGGEVSQFKIESSNNFPTACGIASSASGFSALVGACSDLLQLEKKLTPKEHQTWLTEWSRLGSGSSARSSLLGHHPFVTWSVQEDRDSSDHPCLVYPTSSSFILKHAVVVFSSQEKQIPSSEGHNNARSSPFFLLRDEFVKKIFERVQNGLENHDFEEVAFATELDSFMMHSVMSSSLPPQNYLKDCYAFIHEFMTLRSNMKVRSFWTQDAGPNPHILFHPDDEDKVKNILNALSKNYNVESILYGCGYEGLKLGQHQT